MIVNPNKLDFINTNEQHVSDVFIVDSIPGSGKTSSAINFINNSPDNRNFIYVTPYLDEIKRIIQYCPDKRFIAPDLKNKKGSKLFSFTNLLNKNRNIICTHKLFSMFTPECIDIMKFHNYVLIMDEVANVVDKMDIKQDDLNDILNVSKYAHVDNETKMIVWDKLDYPDNGVFSDFKQKSLMGSIFLYGTQDNPVAFIWSFPVKIFQSFSRTYILTYMFKGQIQAYYFDFFKVQYSYVHTLYKGKEVEFINPDDINPSDFSFSSQSYDKPQVSNVEYYKNLITIVENDKMNSIGSNETKRENNLSSTWYKRNSTDENIMSILKSNCHNFFVNLVNKYNFPSNSFYNMWTVYKDYKAKIQGKGYTKGFVSCNARATNQYKDKCNLAYLNNIYINPIIYKFFTQKGVYPNQDIYALSELIQWIFRSRLRTGMSVLLYIPSSRMRRLLKEWGVIENKIFEDNNDENSCKLNIEGYSSKEFEGSEVYVDF